VLIEPPQRGRRAPGDAELSEALAVRLPTAVEPEVVDPGEELEETRRREQAALAEIERLRARVAAVESWLEAGAAERRMEHLQAQRLLLLHAARRDRRWGFVLSVPTALAVLYVFGVVVLVTALLLGRL
jgi:hypothetical protein